MNLLATSLQELLEPCKEKQMHFMDTEDGYKFNQMNCITTSLTSAAVTMVVFCISLSLFMSKFLNMWASKYIEIN